MGNKLSVFRLLEDKLSYVQIISVRSLGLRLLRLRLSEPKLFRLLKDKISMPRLLRLSHQNLSYYNYYDLDYQEI